MAMRIAFDLDGVLADMDAALARDADRLFGDAIRRRPQPVETSQGGTESNGSANAKEQKAGGDFISPDLELKLRRHQRRRLRRHVEAFENFWESLDEIEPGIVARLAAIALERRWEVIFLTRRPQTAGATAQMQTQRWLEKMGFPLPSVYVVQGSRGQIAAALGLDVVVDDRPENCLDVITDSRAGAILIWRDDQAALPQAAKRLGIHVARTVGECLDIFADLDAVPSASRPSVMTSSRGPLR